MRGCDQSVDDDRRAAAIQRDREVVRRWPAYRDR